MCEKKSELEIEMERDMFSSMDYSFKQLCELLEPINHKPLKWSEAAKFVEQKKFKKAIEHIHNIISAHTYLRRTKLQEVKQHGRSKK